MYRQAVAVDSPSGSAPATPACGTFSAAERDALIAAAKAAFNGETADRRKGGVVSDEAAPLQARCGRSWLALLVLATVIAASLAATTNAPRRPAADPVSNPAHPVVDANWIYADNWYDVDELHLQGRRLGRLPAVGDDLRDRRRHPGDEQQPAARTTTARRSSTPGGRASGRRSTPQPNGELGKFITARDHLFPTRTWQLNDAELTIPGATLRRPAGHAREPQRLDADLDEQRQGRRARRPPAA